MLVKDTDATRALNGSIMIHDNTKYLVARLDGNNFSKLKLQKPFDHNFRLAMVYCAFHLTKFAQANLAYSQSDEISLIWFPRIKEHVYGGKDFKIHSLLASFVSVLFNKYELSEHAIFDCRTFTLETEQDYINYLRERQANAIANSVSMLARAHFRHRDLVNKSMQEQLNMLLSINVKWEEYHFHYKYGSTFEYNDQDREFSDYIDNLPEKHNARKSPEMTVQRKALIRTQKIW